MNYTIEKIATLIGARRYGNQETTVRYLLTDSRSLCFPEETLFFAIKSDRNDGHRYISDLYHRGVRNFVVEQLPESWDVDYIDANFLKVVGTREALQRLAERHRDEFDVPVIGITGSNGKTVVKEWMYQILRGVRKDSQGLHVTRSPRSYNSQIGVPLSVWLLDEHTDVAVFEAGISMPGEMAALRGIIQPTIGVLTNLGAAHQENFSSMEAKCKEKLVLFHDTKAVCYCIDDELVTRCISQYAYKGVQLSWSMKNPKAAFYVGMMETDGNSTRVHYIYNGERRETRCEKKEVRGEYRIPFVDDASIRNSVTCACLSLYLGVSPDLLAQRMSKLVPVAMRLEVKEGQRGCTLINDSYNSDINSIDIALDMMNRRHDPKGRRKTVMLSDIEQSGETSEVLYSKVMELLKKRNINKIIGVGEQIHSFLTEHIEQGIECHSFATVEELVQSETFYNLHDELILIKGARQYGFDKLTELLVQKVHETTLEVNLNALVDNLNHYRSFLKRDTKMVCMIKADGYGAGAVEIAKTLQDHHVDYLAVAVADEGVTLRKAGITSNIMIMNPEMTSFKTMFDNELEPEVYSFRLLDALVKAARQEGITGYPVHIKLDTGMHRLGFNADDAAEIDELISILKEQQAIVPRSVFSHFVGSDSDGFDDFSAMQFERFHVAADQLQAAFDHHILRHMDNSAGIEHFPERQMDMCRLGIGLYGVNPRNNEMIHNVSTLKTTILQLRKVKSGDSIGYSRKTVLDRDSIIGAIPIGYADGLNRHLGNRHGYCLVNGKRAEYVGNICMDVAMIDVTDIPCREGDSVEIFGDNLPVTALSDAIDTIPYEVLTGVSNRVKRIYFQD